MKKHLAVASTLAVLGAFTMSTSSANAGLLGDAFGKAFAAAKDAGKNLIKRGKDLIKPIATQFKAKMAEWKERAASLKGKALKQWNALKKQGMKHWNVFKSKAKSIKVATLKNIKAYREKVRAFWEKAKAAGKKAASAS